jgi:ornithine cyclodeaminase
MRDIRIVVEFEPLARIEGEIQQLDAAAAGAAATPVTELADIVRARRPGRADMREITLFDSVGFALNDFSALRYLRRLNAEHPDGGLRIDLIPELDDPKDLFAGLSQGASARRRQVA